MISSTIATAARARRGRAPGADLDERAWTLQEQLESGGADATEYDAAFRRARAAGAMKMALDANARTAVAETVYEASHAVDEADRFAQLLEAVLDLVEPGNHCGGTGPGRPVLAAVHGGRRLRAGRRPLRARHLRRVP